MSRGERILARALGVYIAVSWAVATVAGIIILCAAISIPLALAGGAVGLVFQGMLEAARFIVGLVTAS